MVTVDKPQHGRKCFADEAVTTGQRKYGCNSNFENDKSFADGNRGPSGCGRSVWSGEISCLLARENGSVILNYAAGISSTKWEKYVRVGGVQNGRQKRSPLATNRSRGTRSVDATSGRLPCTGRDDGGTMVKLHGGSMFTWTLQDPPELPPTSSRIFAGLPYKSWPMLLRLSSLILVAIPVTTPSVIFLLNMFPPQGLALSLDQDPSRCPPAKKCYHPLRRSNVMQVHRCQDFKCLCLATFSSYSKHRQVRRHPVLQAGFVLAQMGLSLSLKAEKRQWVCHQGLLFSIVAQVPCLKRWLSIPPALGLHCEDPGLVLG
ncbi:hypothetical protein DFH06DRAFT_1125563 [Mycena polygramma]|nr:hypothetical protein DFH06DRAFT_1125563 [Mycena polygramma]